MASPEVILDGSVADAATALRAREITARDLVEAAVARPEARDGALGAYKTFDADTAREQANRADEVLTRSQSEGTEAPPLCGIPVSVKDLYAVDGMPTYAGSAHRLPEEPWSRDAALVAGHGALLAAWQAADAQDVYASLKSAGAFRSNSDHAGWLPVVGACAGLDLQPLGDAIERIARSVSTADLPAELSGKAVGEALDAARIEVLRQAQIELSRASG